MSLILSLSKTPRSLPPVCPASFLLFPIRLELLMVLKYVGGSETHEMGILPGPLETRMSDGRGRGRRTRSASAHQGTNPEPMPPVSQDAGAVSILTIRH